jgi:hypothetical protein
MTLGLEDYVNQALHDKGVVGYTPSDVLEIAMSAAIEALDTCDMLIKCLGDGSHFDIRTDPGHDPRNMHQLDHDPRNHRTTLLEEIDHRMSRGADYSYEWGRWRRGEFRR